MWKREAERDDPSPRSPGRPATPASVRAAAKERVHEVVKVLGWSVGEGPVHRALGGSLTLLLVRRSLAELKAEHKTRRRQAVEGARQHVEVLARDALWSLDGTHLGRDDAGVRAVGELVRDVASTATLGASVGPPPTSAEVVVLLQRVVAETGAPPLVLSSDNGGENRGALEEWCKEHRVVHLRNLPHTPQHNPWIEHGNREIKAETGLGKGVRIADPRATAHLLVLALDRIDGVIPRATRGWRPAREAYRDLPPAEALVARERFYSAARCAIDEAVQDSRGSRQRRLDERRAILTTMECFGLIKRTRGREPRKATKPEGVS